jgi:3-methyladenine DNA glycosylase Tag
MHKKISYVGVMIDQILRNKEDYQTVFGLFDIASLVGKQPDENLIAAVSYHI